MEEAPDLDGTGTWLGTDPVTLSTVQKPVLLQIWRYADHDSRQQLQHVKQLQERYSDQFQVVGIHSPRFSFEADPSNVEAALDMYDVGFPVALDTGNTVRHRYGAISPPYTVVIDADGIIRREAGQVDGAVEDALRQVLRRRGDDLPDRVFDPAAAQPGVDAAVSPDVYAGAAHGDGFGNDHPTAPHTTVDFSDDGNREMNRLYLDGPWRKEDEYVAAEGDGHAAVRFAGRECSMVAGPAGAECTVRLYGGPVPDTMHTDHITVEDRETRVGVDHPGLYTVMQRDRPRITEIEVVPRSDEFRLYGFCFG